MEVRGRMEARVLEGRRDDEQDEVFPQCSGTKAVGPP